MPARCRYPGDAQNTNGSEAIIFALYMATIMAFLMSLVITFAEFGVGPHYMENVMNAYQVAMPAAFVCILVVRPIVVRLVGFTVHGH
ncbi:DUF2798 domain-containing protein [Pantoea sp. GM01]|uniref:DUF2798 domain-containing protein n=1 Tax=Pantoea sp. GM01 TaxID=1144320 RepID=UPI0002FB6BD2